MPHTVEPINLAVRDHAISAEWDFAGLVRELHAWAEKFIKEFNLNCPTPVIGIERIRKNWLGHYRPGRNSLGLYDEIVISIEHAMESPKWRVIGTLLHELIHEWQFVTNGRDRENLPKGNYHDNEFRAKAREFGLEISRKGVTEYPDPPEGTPFRKLLAAAGVDASAPMPPKVAGPSRSKLYLFECQCPQPVKLRAGKKEIDVRCLCCEAKFRLIR